LRHPKVVAIGEAGLDHSRLPGKNGGTPADDDAYKARQKSLFQQQLEWARETGLNIVVHQRECFAETLEVLRPYTPNVRAVFHCFVGSPAEAAQVRALGSLVSFTGIATFKNAAVIRETLTATPLGEFMLETDCPFLAPVPHRGKRCEPSFVADLAGFVAREKNCAMEELSAATNRAAESFFPKLKRA
jgi:TatD DNase family protein